MILFFEVYRGTRNPLVNCRLGLGISTVGSGSHFG